MIRRYGPRVVGYGLLLALVIALPHVIPEEKVSDTQLAYVGTFAIALLGLVILTGWTGQISLGHGAFMAIGGGFPKISSGREVGRPSAGPSLPCPSSPS